jgi:hypothetical protein
VGPRIESLTRVHRGAYVLDDDWSALFGEGRLRTRAYAVQQLARRGTAVFGYATAAAIHGLPLYKAHGDFVDILVPDVRGRRNGPGVRRHHIPLVRGDVTEVGGLRVTSLERTVYDIIRLGSLETAVIAMDAALHRLAWNESDNTFATDIAEAFRALVQKRVLAHAGARGIRQARFVVEFADGRAWSPGESLSRLWCWQLGAPEPVLQYRVEFPDDTYALLDLCWPELRRWAEFDGDVKYTDSRMLGGRTPEEIIAAQVDRQVKVESSTGWRCDRWGFEQMTSFDTFARHLRTIGLI